MTSSGSTPILSTSSPVSSAPASPSSPRRHTSAIYDSDVKVDRFLVRRRHVSNESISYIFRSTGNLLQSLLPLSGSSHHHNNKQEGLGGEQRQQQAKR